MEFDFVRRVWVGDVDVAYREMGTGTPLLLVHGWPLSSATWRKVVPIARGEALARMLPNVVAFERVAAAGLLVHGERPDVWTRLVGDFLAGEAVRPAVRG